MSVSLTLRELPKVAKKEAKLHPLMKVHTANGSTRREGGPRLRGSKDRPNMNLLKLTIRGGLECHLTHRISTQSKRQ